MAVLIKSLFIFLSFLLNKPVPTLQLCTPTSCSPTSQQIRFPFGLNSDNSRCSFPGYGLSCNNENQTILNLRYSGDFIVRYINYQTQEIHIRDPGNCLAARFLKNFSLWGSPFIGEFDQSFIFLNCPVKNISTVPPLPYPYARLVGCMSNENDTVVAFPSEYEQYAHSATACTVMASGVKVPVAWSRVAEGYTTLLWTEPDCAECEQSGGTCGFKYESGPIIGCHDQPGRGLPRTVKYGLIIGVGIPGLLCIIGLGCYLCGRLRTYNRSRHFSTDLSTTMPHLPSMFATGLDEPTIELYPKTLLGESRRLPKPNDNICPICLSEYQSKETLRTIPECNHYFHAECIDEWLKMNATCPLCRNSPHLSSITTPTSSSSSSSLGTPSSLSASSSSLFSGR